MASIALLDDYQKVAMRMADWTAIERQHRISAFSQPFASEDEVARSLLGFEVVCLMRERTPFTASLMAKLPGLSLIVTAGHRNAAIDMTAAKARGIVVCGTAAPGHATAELAMGLILGLARNFHVELANMREGRWQTTIGQDVRGKTLGLIGLGRLGEQLGGYAKAFGMTVIAWSENLTAERAAAVAVEKVTKDDLFRRADFLSIHTRLSGRTVGLVGAAELALMKPTAHLINTSRGPIVDEAALLSALSSGRLAGAALDVYDREPLPAKHPLRAEPRLLLTPHIGYVTQETYRAFYGGMVEAIEAWFKGTPIHVITS